MGKKGLRVLLLALASVLLLALVLAMATGAGAEDAEIIGSQPPFVGPWYIDEATTIQNGELNLSKDIYVTRGVELLISNVTLKVQKDPFVKRTFSVMAGATCLVSASTLDLDRFSAESQASLNFEAGSVVRTTGMFNGACNSFFAEDTTFANRAPGGAPNKPGKDAYFIADGKVNSEFDRVTIINEGGNAGQTDPGLDGQSGGKAVIISNITTWIDCIITNEAGESRGGGLGLAGATGGDGGIGADVVIRLRASYMENVDITSVATQGGIGARGSRNTAGNGGNGGDGADGGSAWLSIDSPSVLEMYGCTINVKSGNGGSGGNGGEAINGDGGTAGYGANAGTCTIEISCIDDIFFEETEIYATGGEGGYGGDYGRHESGTGTFGIPRPGGNGGEVMVRVLTPVSMFLDDLKVEARAGAGLDGGGGYDQGETGGDGADSTIIIHAEAALEATGVDLVSLGGNGGPGGPAVSDINGNGGDGGDSKIEFSGLLEMTMDNFSIYVIPGEGGLGDKPIYDGMPGIDTLDLETLDLDAREGTFNMPLDDLSNGARGVLFNVFFDMDFGIHVLPIGDAVVTEWFSVVVTVVDNPDPAKAKPLEDYEVAVFDIATGALVIASFSDGNGKCYFDLMAFEYTSEAVNYKGSYHFIVSSPDRKTTKKVRGEIQGKTELTISIEENIRAPEIVIETPEEGKNYPFDKEENRVMEVTGYATDEDGSPIISMYVQLYPEKGDPKAWPEFKLGLSPVPLEDLVDKEIRWGKYFPPDEHSNRWKFFYRFVIVGGDVLYESDAFTLRVTANDAVHISPETISIDVQIEPEQEPPKMRVYASVNPGVEALDLVEFNGTVLNVESRWRSTHGTSSPTGCWTTTAPRTRPPGTSTTR